MKQVEAMQKENARLEKKLPQSYQKDYTDMIIYLRGAKTSLLQQEIVRRDIIEILLGASERQEPIESVIGQDLKGFCDAIMEELPPMSWWERISENIDTFTLIFLILFTVKNIFSEEVLTYLKNFSTGDFFNVKVTYYLTDLIFLVLSMLIAVSMVDYMIRHAFDQKTRKQRYQEAFMAGLIFGLFILGFVISSYFMKSVILFHLPLGGAVALMVIGWISYGVSKAL